MRLYVDLETLQLIDGPGFRNPVSAIRFKRGDAAQLEVTFLTSGTTPATIGDPATLELQFGIKPRGRYDVGYLVHETEWTLPEPEAESPAYLCTPSFNTAELDSAMQVGSAAGSELSEVMLMGEITWREGAGEPTSTRTFLVVVENDVNRGTEGTPSSLPSPDDFVAARAILFDRVQVLGAAEKAQALRNLGLPGNHDYAATRYPDANDDSTQGWEVGSLWVVTAPPPLPGSTPGAPADLPDSDDTGYSGVEIYRCVDATEGAAVWHMTTLDPTELGRAAFRDTVFAGLTAPGTAPPLVDHTGAALTEEQAQGHAVCLDDTGRIPGKVNSHQVSDAGATGRAVLQAADAPTARTAMKIVTLTQAAYDLLSPPDADTLYIITA